MAQIIKIGCKFQDGKVIGIFRNGVLTVQGELTRFYTKEKVETLTSTPKAKKRETAVVS